jgi:hypothetical protein
MNSNAADSQLPPSTHSFDFSALKALQLAAKGNKSGVERERAKTIADRVALQIKDDGVRGAFTRLFDYVLQQDRMAEIGQSVDVPTEEIRTIGRFGMVRSAEFVAAELADLLAAGPLTDILRTAPSARFIELIAKRHKGVAIKILDLISADAAIADRSASLDWLVKHGKPADLVKVATLLISKRERRPHLSPYEKLLALALRRDKGATLLQAALSASKDDAGAVGRIGAAVTGNPKVMAQVLKSFPKLIASEHSEFAFYLLKDWLIRYPSLSPRARESLSVAVTGLALAVLKKPKRNESQQKLLDILSRSLSGSLSKMKDSDDLDRFWIFGRASDLAQSLSDSCHVSPFGARLVATAMEKVASGNAADSVLEALALNLGMNPVASAGATATFDPEMHEDVEGGLLAGDPVVVQAAGWAINGQPIRRAKVTPHEHS